MLQRFAAPLWLGIFFIQLPSLATYFRQLMEIPAYTWLPLAVVLALLCLTMVRWNRTPQLPDSWLAICLTLGGLVLSAVSAVASFRWLAVTGFCLTGSGFWASHSDRQGRSLIGLWPLMLPLVRPPLDGFAVLQGALSRWVLDTSCGVMRYFRIAHVQIDSAISLPATRLYPDQWLNSLAGWPLFLTLAMLHSVLFRRHWTVTLLNAVSSFAACFLFHTGLIITTAYLQSQGSRVPNNDVPWLVVAWGVIAGLLFLSAERGWRGMLTPIADGEEDARQANPLVIAWNRLLQRPTGESKPEVTDNSPAFKYALMALPVLLVLTTAVQATQLPTLFASGAANQFQWRPKPASVESVWTRSDVVDHRLVVEKHLQWGNVADVWTRYLPSRTTDFVVTLNPQRWRDLPAAYVASGWEPIASDTAVDETSGTDSVAFASLQRDDQFGLLFYAAIDQDGTLRGESAESDGTCIMLHAFSVLLREPNEQTRQALSQEFSSLCAAVIADYTRDANVSNMASSGPTGSQ